MADIQSPSAALFELIKEAFNNPALATILEECGSIFVGKYFVWEYDEEESMFYAINPFDQQICALGSLHQNPQLGLIVEDEDDIEILYNDIFEYLGEYRLKQTVCLNPKEEFFKLVEELQKSPKTLQLLEEEGGFINKGYFVWPVDTDDDDDVFVATNSSLQEVYELDFPEQDPINGNRLFSDEDFIWLLEDLKDFIKDIPFDEPFNSLAESPYARYAEGFTYGSVHSLS